MASSCSSHHSREQRVTGIIVFVLTGISVFLAPILKVKHSCSHIPAPSLKMWEEKAALSPTTMVPYLGMGCHLPWGKHRVSPISPVHPHAGAVRSLPLHGCCVAEWHPGESSSSSSSSFMSMKWQNAGILTPSFAL